METRWQFKPYLSSASEALTHELGVSPLLGKLLAVRGFDDIDEAHRFLNPSLQDLHDPWLMKDMDRVVARLFQARERGESVLIYGDYDVDGITSTVVLKRALEMVGVTVGYYIPRRLEEGYGLQIDVIRQARQDGYSLVVTADSGIRAFEVCAAARELGLDLVVTDHHLPDQHLPEAWAILNPRRPDCGYPEKNLAAVGVVFKLVQALLERAEKAALAPHFLKLVAVGTIADLVSLTGENRVITRFGLDGLADPRNLGLKTLLEGCGIGPLVDNFDIGFKMAPRINAVTRMGGRGEDVVELFSLDDLQQARSFVEKMNHMNELRRSQEDQILAQALETLEQDPGLASRRFLVATGRDWHRGVIGIVASRLVERFHRPVLVLSEGESGFQGSGRSIPGFHLLSALDSARDLFLRYGGHAQAVGCTLAADRGVLEELVQRLEEHAQLELTEEMLQPSIQLDAQLSPADWKLGSFAEIQRLAPFGVDNPVPVFATRGVPVRGGPWIVGGRHLKFLVGENGTSTDALWWGNGSASDRVQAGGHVDLAYRLVRNEYQGIEQVQLVIHDLRPSASPDAP